MDSPASAALLSTASAGERATRAERSGPGAEPIGGDLRLAQLLCSRLCHDLIGAAGAISNGMELLADNAADSADIHDLLGLSGRQLNRRLAFYRYAFAMNGQPSGAASLAEARRLSADLLADTKVSLVWRDDRPHQAACVDDVDPGLVRVLLCAVLIAAEGLTRGGSIEVRIVSDGPELTIAIVGEGRDAMLSPPVLAALDPLAAAQTVTARTVPAYYLGRLAHQLGAGIDVAVRPGGFAVRIDTVRP